MRNLLIGRLGRGCDQRAVGQRNACVLGLCADPAHAHVVDAAALVTVLADFARVVRGEEGPNHEIPDLHVLDVGADFFDHAHVFVAHGCGFRDIAVAAVGPKIRTADARSGHANDGVRGFFDDRIRAIFDSDITGGVNHDTAHNETLLELVCAVFLPVGLRISRTVITDACRRSIG